VPVARLVAEPIHVEAATGRRQGVAAALECLRQFRSGLVLEGNLRAIARDGLD